MLDQTLFPIPEPPKRPPGRIVRAAEIDPVQNCRWTLRRSWGAGPAILWCGTNPSTADAERDDPTILREIGFSYRWGFGSMVKVNLEPYITSDPATLRQWLRSLECPGAREANALRIKDEFEKVDVCVAAWGAILTHEEVEDALWNVYYKGHRVTEIAWKCLGLTLSGAPKHTLARGKHRIPDDAKLVDFNFEFEDTYG